MSKWEEVKEKEKERNREQEKRKTDKADKGCSRRNRILVVELCSFVSVGEKEIMILLIAL